MTNSKKKIGKSEVSLVKDFCSRSNDDDLRLLAEFLPPKVAFDRASACLILQKDQQVDRWLQQSSGYDDFLCRIDSIGDFAAEEMNVRMSKK